MADPFYDLTTALLSFEPQDGFDASLAIDRSAQPGGWVLSGSTQLSTLWSNFGNRSLRMASPGECVYRNDNRVVEFGTNPLCIEGWMNADASQPGQYPVLFGVYPDQSVTWQAGALGLFVDHPDAPNKLSLHIVNAGSTFLKSTTTVTGAGSLHFAVTRDSSSVWRLFINGVQEDSFTFSGSVNTLGTLTKYAILGSDSRISSPNDYYLGYIDEFRITIGAPRYTSNFTPSTVAFEFVPITARVIQPGLIQQLPIGTIPVRPIAREIGASIARRDAYFAGDGVIYGTVTEQGAPANVPLRRKVLLLDETTNIIMRETWSDAVTGAYSFASIDRSRRYTVITYDYAKNYRAVIADNLVASVAA